MTHKLESTVPKEFSHCCEGSEPHSRLHSLGQRDWEFPRNLTLKPSEIWLQNFHRTGGNGNSSLGGHYKTLHAPRLRGKEQWLHRRLNQNYLLLLEGLLWRRESAGAHYRGGGLDWEGPPWYTCSWCVCVLVAQLCLTLCDPMDWGLPGSFVHGILQARILECVAMPFSRGSSQPRDQTWVSCFAGRFFTVWATNTLEDHHSPNQGLVNSVQFSSFTQSYLTLCNPMDCGLGYLRPKNYQGGSAIPPISR